MLENIKKEINQIFIELGIKEQDIKFDFNSKFCDLSTNVLLKLNIQDKLTIGNKIVEKVKNKYIKNITFLHPGFINIDLSNQAYIEKIQDILLKKFKFGSHNQNQKINVEYVSANPTGSLHIGHARNAVFGSILVNILKFAGNQVEQEYYVNDFGNQIEVLIKTFYYKYMQKFNVNINQPNEIYKSIEIEEMTNFFIKKFQDEYVNKTYEQFFNFFKSKALNYMIDKIKKDLQKLNVEIENYFFESSTISNVSEIIYKLKNTYKKDNALFLKTTLEGDIKDRVLVKSDSSFTYFVFDIAYHQNKMERNYDKLINVWGADHYGHDLRLKSGLKNLGYDVNKLEIIFLQLTRLIENGKEIRMSKRLGTNFTIKNFLEEVKHNLDTKKSKNFEFKKEIIAKDIIRFFLSNNSSNSMINFDFELIKKNFEQTPIYKIKYAYARISKIILDSKIQNEFNFLPSKANKIIKLFFQFPELIQTITQNNQINLLNQYLLNLASETNSFYSQFKIIGNKHEKTIISLLFAIKQVMEISANLLGISLSSTF